jgi:hypothetical protein
MKSIAISNFPSELNENKLKSEFLSRGIRDIEFITSTEARNLTVNSCKEYENIFIFCDLLSHSDYYSIKATTKKAGINLSLLNRKSSSWSIPKVQEKKESTKMPPAKSVSEENIIPLLKKYVALVEKGSTYDELIDGCAQFWTGRPLNTYKQLYNYISKIAREPNCPKFFYDHYYGTKDHPENTEEPFEQIQTAVVEQVNEETTTQNQDTANGPSVEDLQTWNKLLEEENASISSELKSTKNKLLTAESHVSTLEKTISALRSENEGLTKGGQSSASWKVKEAVVACKRLVELDVMDPKEAFERISNMLLKIGM